MASRSQPAGGMHYGLRVRGKHEYRVRERYVAEHLVPLIAARRVGAAKLDLLLRGVALLPEHAGDRTPGTVLPTYSWQQLHDLVRTAGTGSLPSDADADAEARRLKRKWVGDQLAVLEQRGLVAREAVPGRRSRLVVLKDDGTGDPFDDPDGSEGSRYVRVLGGIFANFTFASWDAPQVSAFLAAMIAERHVDLNRDGERTRPGTAQWFRPLGWFADRDNKYGPPGRQKFNFAPATLRRGLASFNKSDLVRQRRSARHPSDPTRTLHGPRVIYLNRFASLQEAAGVMTYEEYLDAIAADDSSNV